MLFPYRINTPSQGIENSFLLYYSSGPYVCNYKSFTLCVFKVFNSQGQGPGAIALSQHYFNLEVSHLIHVLTIRMR